ncbi:MAG: hypothetical protein M1834_005421 [Cirrosporium novae-zelandiae]|nr:MAG: hypothetical protein M1834_005421 [Cirrosporium novae-zelandiae]
MTSNSPHSAYSSTYERMTGNCTRLIAAEMISTITPPITSSSHVLDNACGPGIVSEQVKLVHRDTKIMATDLSSAMIEEVQQRVKSQGWSNVRTETLDIRSLSSSLPVDIFTHVLTNLGLPIPNDPDYGLKAVREMFRVLQPGGVAMVSTWADRVWPNAFLNTARTIRPHELPHNSLGLDIKFMRGSWLMEMLENAGFGNNVEVRPFVTYTSARSLDELVENMMLAKGMFFPGYSDQELQRAKSLLREELQKTRTFEKVDGGVRIGMKAWIGVGWKRGDETDVPL